MSLEAAIGDVPEMHISKMGPPEPLGKALFWTDRQYELTPETRESHRAEYENILAERINPLVAYRASFIVDEFFQDAVDHQDGRINIYTIVFENRVVILPQFFKGYDVRHKGGGMFNEDGTIRGLDHAGYLDHGRGKEIVDLMSLHNCTIDYGAGAAVHVRNEKPN